MQQLKGEFFSQFRNSGVTFTVKSATARKQQLLRTLPDINTQITPPPPQKTKQNKKTTATKRTGNGRDL